VAKQDQPWFVGKDQGTGQSLITTGDGTEKYPFLQIKLLSDKVNFWGGWHVRYDAWKGWRNNVTLELLRLSSDLPSSFVAQLVSQVSIVIPQEKVKGISEIPTLQPLIEFHRRYLPDEFIGKGGAYAVFANDSLTKSVETQATGNPTTNEQTFTFLHRWMALDPQNNVEQNLLDHYSSFDELLEKFNANYLSMLIKP